MLLRITAPDMEGRMEREASRRGLSPEEYLLQLLAQYLPQEQSELGVSVPDNSDEWNRRFDLWASGRSRRKALPESVFERASFYPEVSP